MHTKVKYLAVCVFMLLHPMLCKTYGVVLNTNDTTAKARILFIGLWDRAFEYLDEASKLANVPIEKLKIADYTTPEKLQSAIEKISFSRYDLIYVLQINEIEANILAAPLQKAIKENPQLKIVQLDYRSTQQELLNKGILKTDPIVLEYWKNFGVENLKRLLRYSAVKYLGEPDKPGTVLPPAEIAKSGIYHTDRKGFFLNWEEYLSWYEKRPHYNKNAPWVSLILKPDYIIYNNALIYDSLISALEQRGINVCAYFGDLSDLRNHLRASKPNLMVLLHHTGPEGTDKDNGKTFLEELNIPYLYGAGLLGNMTISDWKKDVKGGSWSEYASIPVHEYHGIIEPHILGAKANTGKEYMLDVPIPDRVHRFADRIKSWLTLQFKPNSEKKIAIIYFHKYLSKAEVGRSAMEMGRYFNVPPSLQSTLETLKANGYKVDSLPVDGDMLLGLMIVKARNIASWRNSEIDDFVINASPILIPEEQYKQWFYSELSPENQKLVIDNQGPPPGNRMIWKDNKGKCYIVIPRLKFGNIILAPQPSIGVVEDSLLIKAKTIPPSHNFLAFYWWLQKEYKADALVHFGAFGSDISLPGKEIFLSKNCFPDIILGNMPNLYVWPIENIAIGMIAKRRTYAVLIDHFVAPILPAEFSIDYINLENAIHHFLESNDQYEMKEEYRKSVTAQVKKLKFQELLRIPLSENQLLSDKEIDKIWEFISYANIQNTPQGMHVFGKAPPDSLITPYIAYILFYNTHFYDKLKELHVIEDDGKESVKSDKIHRLINRLLVPTDSSVEIANLTGLTEKDLKEKLKEEILYAKQVNINLRALGESEKNSLLAALSGKYISPGPGGTPLSNPDVLPTGRNMYGISPNEIPTKEAWKVGKTLLDQTLQNYRKEHGEYPKRISFSLTGMETFKDMGVMEAQIFDLVGVTPLWNEGGKISGLEVIPREKLGRPRIDPLVSISSIYLKNFPNIVQLLDLGIRMAAALDEDSNYVKNVKDEIREKIIEHGIYLPEAVDGIAGTRIFGSEAGQGGARLIWLIPRSGTWESREDLAYVWMNTRSYGYGKDQWSEQNDLVYVYAMMGREITIANWGNNLYGPLTNHHYPEETGGFALAQKMINKKSPDIIIQDLRNKNNPVSQPLDKVLSAELLATGFNEKWIRGQMGEGYQGATQFMQISDNLFQWKAVNEDVIPDMVWRKIISIYFNDEYKLNIQQWFETNNPYASQEMIAIMLEAARKNFWEPTAEEKKFLTLSYAKSVTKYGFNSGTYSGGNVSLHRMVTRQIEATGDSLLLRNYKMEISGEKKEKLEKEQFKNRD